MSYSRSVNAFMNKDVDIDALDELAKTNFQVREKQLSLMKNFLHEASEVVGGYKSTNIDAVCERLQKEGFGCYECKIAFKLIPDRFDRFPSYKDIKELARGFKRANKEELDDPQCDIDRDRYQKIKNVFMSKWCQSDLDKYVTWWLSKNYSLNGDYLPIGLTLTSFEMPALFDWFDGYGRWDMNAIQNICNKKKAHIEDFHSKNLHGKRIPSMWINKNDPAKFSIKSEV